MNEFPPAVKDAFTVSQVNRRIESVLAAGFPEAFWVTGEVQGYDRDAGKAGTRRWGQVYFELIEKAPGTDAVKAGARAIVWGDAHAAVCAKLAAASRDLRFQDGLQVRLLCAVDFYWPRASLQLKILDVDPHFTLGDMERARRELLAALAREGLLEANRLRPLSLVPLHVGLVTAEGSAAFHDFVQELRASGYAFHVSLVDSRMQGADTESDVCRALAELGRREDIDVIALVRGGGSRSDLMWFDREGMARAIALCPKPVITGIGHEIDLSVADAVSHAHVKTPTAAAQFLVERVAAFDASVSEHAARLSQSARLRVESLRQNLTDMAQAFARDVQGLLDRWRGEIDRQRAVLRGEARRHCAVERERLGAWSPRLRRFALESLARMSERVDHARRACAANDPRRLLARGYSLVWLEGRLVKRVAQAIPSASFRVDVSDGAFTGRVTGSEENI